MAAGWGLNWPALKFALTEWPVFSLRVLSSALSVALLLALIAIAAARFAPVLGLAAFVAIPVLGGVANYPALHTPQLAQLSAWARASTPRDAVFFFPDAGHALDPGIFRADSVRAVYVDWKGGGQVNYFADFAREWGRRWQIAMAGPLDISRYAPLGIDYIVLRPQHRLARAPSFEDAGYVVYAVTRTHRISVTLDHARASIAHGEGRVVTQESMRELAAEVKERGRARLIAELGPSR